MEERNSNIVRKEGKRPDARHVKADGKDKCQSLGICGNVWSTAAGIPAAVKIIMGAEKWRIF